MRDFQSGKVICASAGAALSIVLSCAAAPANAQAYPQRPVRVIVNVSAGGGVDSLARIVVQHLAGVWGQPFVVDNRTGAGGSIGIEMTAKAAPDGYTLLICSSGVVTNAAFRSQGYDPVHDLRAITRLTSNPYIIVVTPSLPAATVKELLALAKTKPGGVSYASSGVGSILHMGAELLSMLTGTPMVHVPYKGSADGYPGVASGQADWILGGPISALPLIKAGRLKGIAVTSTTRSRAVPELPTVAESGVPGYEVVVWFGMFSPARLPSEIIAKLNAESKRALQIPDIARRIENAGMDPGGNSSQDFANEVKTEFAKWRKVVKKIEVKF